MKLEYRAVEESLQLGAAWRCAGHAVEPVCLVFGNTWAEILKIWNYMWVTSLSLPGSAMCRSQYEAFLFSEIQDWPMQTYKWD